MIPQTVNNKKKNNKKKLFIASCFVALILAGISLHATKGSYNKKASFVANVISEEENKKTQEEKIITLQKAAKGFFTNMRFAATPSDMKELSFKDLQGKDHKLAQFTGKPILLNLWAIWCAPCRTEMPELAQLKRELSGERFDVIAINTDKTASPQKIQQFLQNVDADNLVYYRDETMDIFNNLRKQGLALGLPITLLIDKNGYLIASYNGAAPWANDDAKALIKAVIRESQ